MAVLGNRSSPNGDLVELISEVTDMHILNLNPKCKGITTWFRNNQSSTIDYVLANNKFVDCFQSMLIDENSEVASLGSDHAFLIVNAHVSQLSKQSNKVHTDKYRQVSSEDIEVVKWDIGEDTKWMEFRNSLSNAFQYWDIPSNMVFLDVSSSYCSKGNNWS